MGGSSYPGLDAMTGVLPVIAIAGTATAVAKSFFPDSTSVSKKVVRTMKAKSIKRVRKSARTVKKARKTIKGHPGKFSNLGL